MPQQFSNKLPMSVGAEPLQISEKSAFTGVGAESTTNCLEVRHPPKTAGCLKSAVLGYGLVARPFLAFEKMRHDKSVFHKRTTF